MRQGIDERCARESRHRRRVKSREDLRCRYRLRDLAQLISPQLGVRACGKGFTWEKLPDGKSIQRRSVDLVISIIEDQVRAHFRGIVKCKNPWQCAICTLTLQLERGKLVQQLNEKHLAAGGAFDMGTFTIPHDEGDPIKALRKKVADSWRRVISGAPWKRWKEALGIVGQIRAHEVTHGKNGFHPHVHVAFYYGKQITDQQREAFRAFLDGKWRSEIVKPDKNGRRWRAPSAKHGVTLEPLRQTDYLTKMGLARELVMATTKEGREGHRTLFQVLRDTMDTIDSVEKAAGLKIWREWSRGMRGARQLTTSRGLFTRYGLPELSDRQLFLEKDGALADSQILITFSAEEWGEILRMGPIVRVMLQEVVDVPAQHRLDYVVKTLERAAGIDPAPF